MLVEHQHSSILGVLWALTSHNLILKDDTVDVLKFWKGREEKEQIHQSLFKQITFGTRDKFIHEYFRMLSQRKFLLNILFVFSKTHKKRTLKNFLLWINFPWDITESKELCPSHSSDWLLIRSQSSLRRAISKAYKDQNSHWEALKQEIHLNRKKSWSPSSSWTVGHQKLKEE